MAQSILGLRGNKGPSLFPRRDNYEIMKIHWRNLKIFFLGTTWPILTKLGTKHSWVKGIHICPNEEPRPFSKEDNYEIAKMRSRKIFSKITGPISTKLGTKHSWVKGFTFLQMKNHAILTKGIMGIFLLSMVWCNHLN